MRAAILPQVIILTKARISTVSMIVKGCIIIEPHSRGVPEAILNVRSPRAGLPECGRSPHEGRPARGKRTLSVAEGTPSREVLFLLHPFLNDSTLNNTENMSS